MTRIIGFMLLLMLIITINSVSFASDGSKMEKSLCFTQLSNDTIVPVDSVLSTGDTLGIRSEVRPDALGNNKQIKKLYFNYEFIDFAKLYTKTKASSDSLYLTHAHSMCRYLNQA